MITASLTGNFGNHQLFYMFTRTVAETLGYDYGFNPTPSHDYYNGKQQMDFMDIDYGIIHDAKYGEMPDGIENIWKEKFEPISNSAGATFHPYDPSIWDIQDNTQLILRCVQDARYYADKKTRIQEWFKIKSEEKSQYNILLENNNIVFSDDLCIINVRGGEYKGVYSLLLQDKYWVDSINIMRNHGVNKFVVITDDVQYASTLFPDYPVVHFGIGCDYYTILKARNLILSNSSFALIPAWLNENHAKVIAPKFWARHNISGGYWASSDIWTFGVDNQWDFLDREGSLSRFSLEGKVYES